MLQEKEFKTNLSARNLGRAQTPARGQGLCGHMSELLYMAPGIRQHTLLELNCLQSSGRIGARGRTAVGAGSLLSPVAMRSALLRSLVLCSSRRWHRGAILRKLWTKFTQVYTGLLSVNFSVVF